MGIVRQILLIEFSKNFIQFNIFKTFSYTSLIANKWLFSWQRVLENLKFQSEWILCQSRKSGF